MIDTAVVTAKPSDLLKSWPKDRHSRGHFIDAKGNRCAVGILTLHTPGLVAKAILSSEDYLRLEAYWGLAQHDIGDVMLINDNDGLDAAIAHLESIGH